MSADDNRQGPLLNTVNVQLACASGRHDYWYPQNQAPRCRWCDRPEIATITGAVRAEPQKVDYDALDPGIRETVRLLNEAGFETSDSGDGVSKPAEWYGCGEAIPFPHVVAATTPETMVIDAERMASVLGAAWNVEVSYATLDKTAHLFARTLDPCESSASPSDDGARQPQEDYTRQFFRKLRAFDWLSAPEAILEEDGDIGCDWFVNGATVSAHVSANGRAGWAALIGEHKSHGTFQLPDWLETFTESLRLLAAASDDGARQPTCDSCVHLTPFELAPELCTCPVLNIRIHRESASVFGCNQHEVAPKADMHYRIPHSFRAACGAPSAWGIHWTTEAAQVTCGTCLTARAAASDDGARQPQDIRAIRERLLKHTRGEELAWSPEYSKWRMLKDIQTALAEIDRLQADGEPCIRCEGEQFDGFICDRCGREHHVASAPLASSSAPQGESTTTRKKI